jgi:hypothetical protein
VRVSRLALIAALVFIVVGLSASTAAAAPKSGAAPPPKWLTPEIRDRIAAAGPEGVHISTIRGWLSEGLADELQDPSDFAPCFNGDPRGPSVNAGACQVYPYGCTANFIFHKGSDPFLGVSDGRNYFIGIAGHCVDHANQPSIMEIQNGVLAVVGEVEKILAGDIGQNGRGNGGLGNDYAIIEIDEGFDVEPAMPPQVGGGPNGIYTGCSPQVVKYWGHGFGVVVGPGKVNGGPAPRFYDRSYSFTPATAVALPGDSGSGVMTQSNQSVGDLTHIIIGIDPRYFPGTTIGTRVTRALTWMGGDYFQVNANRTYSRATMADTTCGNANLGSG